MVLYKFWRNLEMEGTKKRRFSKRLGHSDVSMTLQIYTHLLDKNDDELIDHLEKISTNVVKCGQTVVKEK